MDGEACAKCGGPIPVATPETMGTDAAACFTRTADGRLVHWRCRPAQMELAL